MSELTLGLAIAFVLTPTLGLAPTPAFVLATGCGLA